MPESCGRRRDTYLSGQVAALLPEFPSLEETAAGCGPQPRNMGELPRPDGIGRARIPCGDCMQIGLRIIEDVVAQALFMTNGCDTVVACGDAVTELARGKSTAEAMLLDEDDIAREIGGLPPAERHAARLALAALKQALIDYLSMKRDPWKKPYRLIRPFAAEQI